MKIALSVTAGFFLVSAIMGQEIKILFPPSADPPRVVRLEPGKFPESYVLKGHYRISGTKNAAALLTLSFRNSGGDVLVKHEVKLPGTNDESLAFFDEYAIPSGTASISLECRPGADGRSPEFSDCSLRPGKLRDYRREFFPELPPGGARFPIFGWCPPVTGKNSSPYRTVQELYGSDRIAAEYSYANFTIWGDPDFGALRHVNSSEVIARKVAPGELWAVIGKDEPVPANFPKYLAEKEEIARILPGVPYFNNLLPCHAVKVFKNADEYLAYLKQYRDRFRPRFVTADIYVLRDRPPVYYQQFWNQLYDMQSVFGGKCDWGLIMQVLHFGSMRSPTEAELRFQTYSSLAFGAKVLGWFTFLEPFDSKLSPAADAIIQRDGSRSFHYPMIRKLNREVITLGSLLLELHCTGTRLIPTPAKHQRYRELPRPDDAVIQAEGGDMVIGEFSHHDGRRFVMLVNRDFMKSAHLIFTLNQKFSGLKEISRGGPAQTLTANKENQLGIDFSAGDGMLFELIPKQESVPKHL